MPADPHRTARSSAVHGARWGLVSAAVEQGGTLLSTVVLARLLSPKDFGLVAAATIVVTLFAIMSGLGLGAALIRRKDVDEVVLSSTFWATTGVGLVLSAAVALGAPGLATLVRQPDTAPYLVALSPILLIGMWSGVSEALLQRQMRFSAVYTADIVAVVANVIASIGFTVAGAGAWALVAGRVSGSVAGTGYRFMASGWRPSRRFSWQVVREDLGFNSGFLGMAVGGYLTKNLDTWTVSRNSSASGLGAYSVAYLVPNLLRQRMTWLSIELLFPVMARSEGQAAQRRMYLSMIRQLAMAAVPVLVGVAAVAPEIIDIGFGHQWQEAIVPMQVLSIAAAIDVVNQTTSPVYLSRGRPGLANRILVVRGVVLALGLAVSVLAGGGLVGVAWAVVGSTAVALLVNVLLLRRLLDIEPIVLLRDLRGALVGGAGMYVIVLGLRAVGVDNWNAIGRLFALVPAGFVAFLAIAAAVDRAAVSETRSFVRELARRRRSTQPATGDQRATEGE